ncbi:MAG: hypothetical protein ACOCVM_07060 [Desulfovibrionaceae bacterium]
MPGYEPQRFPPNDNDVKAFIHAWFACADHDGDMEWITSHMEEGAFRVNIPGHPIDSMEGLRRWRRAVKASIEQEAHDIERISVSRRGDRLIVADIRGLWKGLEKGRPFERPMHQVWTIESTEDAPLLIRVADLLKA